MISTKEADLFAERGAIVVRGAFVDDDCNWRRIPQYRDFLFESGVGNWRPLDAVAEGAHLPRARSR